MSRTSEIDELINEVRLLYNVLAQVGELLHEMENLTMGMRAVLEYLDSHGPHTVPEIARARRVTRQRVQTLVDQLLEDELVEALENVAHKRSVLIALTAAGERTITRMRERERTAIKSHGIETDSPQLRRALKTLREIRAGLSEAYLDD